MICNKYNIFLYQIRFAIVLQLLLCHRLWILYWMMLYFHKFFVNLMVSKVMDLCKFWSIIQYHYKNLVNHYYRAKFDFFKTSIQSYLLPWRDRLYRAMRFLNNWVLVYIGISFNLRIHLRIWNKFDFFYFKYSS